ncbi:MAG: ABC transporter permease subunit [Oscillospiraceae bacterium]
MRKRGSAIQLDGIKKKNNILTKINKNKYLYMLLLPVIVYYIVFKYFPMYGVIIGFKDFKFSEGVLGSAWVGLKHFKALFGAADFYMILKNTLLLNLYSIVFSFPAPIILAILLNELKGQRFKRSVQSILYVPHFLSWIVLGGMVMTIFSPSSGVVNALLKIFGGDPIYFMIDDFWWPVIFTMSGIWQSAGWGTIIYLAAISGIDPELYEAAKIDGAGKIRCMMNITLPSIKGTIAIMLILRMGSVMDVGFEQVIALQNPAVRDVSEVISTYVYRVGLQGAKYSYTTAIGLFQSVISFILVVGTNALVNKLNDGEGGLW